MGKICRGNHLQERKRIKIIKGLDETSNKTEI